MNSTLDALAEVLEQRKHASPSSSYVAGLYAGGVDGILRKIGEETTELILAGKSGSDQAVAHETADLWFHTLVLLANRGMHPNDILQELASRLGRSGLAEKASRSKHNGN